MAALPETLFLGTAQALRHVQRYLDFALPHRPPRVFAIPEAAVDAGFGILERQGRILWIFGKEQEERLEHRIRFAVRLAPLPQPPLASPAEPAAEVALPPWIVPPAAQRQVFAELKNALAAMGPGEFEEERILIDEAVRNRDDDPGIAVLRLSDEPERFLVARIGHRRDGLFLLDRAADGRVSTTILRTIRTKAEELPWAPFHSLFTRLRVWQRRGQQPVPTPGLAIPERFGNLEVSAFVRELWQGYAAARAALGAAQAPYYRLDGAGAELTYSIPPDQGGPGDGDAPFIRGRAEVRITAPASSAGIQVILHSPEFAITGTARDDLLRRTLDYVARPDSGFWKELAKNGEAAPQRYFPDYRAAFADSTRRADALFLLSYEDMPAKNEFLTVWTGAINGEEREFAWRFRLEKGAVRDPEIVMRLEDPLDARSPFRSGQKPFGQATVPYGRDHPALHDFFHAVWIWQLMGKWFGGGQ